MLTAFIENIRNMKTIISLFQLQVESTPGKVVITDQDSEITLAELDEKSDTIAQCILEKKVGDHPIVGFCLNRNIRLVIGLLGILKAGGIFLPLDPQEPKLAIHRMLKDAHCLLVLTDSETLANHPWLAQLSIIIIDQIKPLEQLRALPIVQDEDFAYLIYTSGSTGKPKGVLCQQRTVINRFEWFWKNYPYLLTDVCCQKAPIGYVDCIWEFFSPLLQGIPYFIIADDVLFNPVKLLYFLEKNKITRIELVPSLLAIILQEMMEEKKRLLLLNFWVVSGEKITPYLVNQFKSILPNSVLLNRFGSTEATSYLWYPAHLWNNDSQSVPIGKPIDGAVIYILDKNMKPVDQGEMGELYVGGPCLSWGYWNDPELNQEKYINNPFISKSDKNVTASRLYKTGDLVRELASGDLEYIGRVDYQIKIHGYRVEPEEIEAALREHQNIKDAKVILQKMRNAEYLCAYYILINSKKMLSVDDITLHLCQILPPYLIPNFFIKIDQFPLNKSGKLDRRALPKPHFGKHLHQFISITTNKIESTLIKIWMDILEINQVASNDNFFSLGGDSLLAMKLVAKIYKIFNVSLNIVDFWERPTIAQLAEHIQNLITIGKDFQKDIELYDHLPLSSIEEEIWFLSHFENSDGSNYHTYFVVQLDGYLNYHAIRDSINDIVECHDVLRMRFYFKNGHIYCHVFDNVKIDVPISEPLESEVEEEIQKYIHIPFNFERDFLLRVKIIKLTEVMHILLIVHHHMINDDWSSKIFFQDLSILYNGYISDKRIYLKNCEKYTEFAIWQQKQIQKNAYANHLVYWKNIFTNVNYISLVADYQRIAVRTAYGDICKFSIDERYVKKLQEMAKQRHCTLFIFLLSIFSIFISRYAAQDDIIIGTPVSLRDNPVYTDVMGALLNTIGLRFKFDKTSSFFDILEYIKKNVMEALKYKDVPFHLLLRNLNLEKISSGNSLFNIMFVYQDYDFKNDLKLKNLNANFLDTHNQRSKYELLFIFEKIQNRIVVKIEYSTDIFMKNSIIRFLNGFNCLLENIIDEPFRSPFSVSILSKQDYEIITNQWNKTVVPISTNVTIPSLFEKQACVFTNNVAIEYQDQIMTYDELNQLANQIAHTILNIINKNSQIEAKEQLVAVCLPRSPMMIATLLGILKAGCAYVPVDLQYPYERLKNILQQSEPVLFICTSELAIAYPDITKITSTVMTLDRLRDQIISQPKININLSIDPAQLAQIIYTSGSTGKPKGVMLEHASIVNRLLWMQSAYQLLSTDKFLHKTSYIFDVSVGEIFWPLSVGACLVIAEPGKRRDFLYLVEFIEERKVTHLHFVPSALPIFLDVIRDFNKNGEKLSSLKSIFCSGEALSTELASDVLNLLNVKLHNIYGPTETGEVTFYNFQRDSELETAICPIGKPIQNTRAYILDTEKNPVPIGVHGELYIAGNALARGYFSQPELTAEKFFVHSILNERLYKTNDIVYWLPDGNINFVGRADFQVKIRGNRIELEEIESVINTYLGVRHSVVDVKIINEERYLIAYYISDNKNVISANQIKNFLQAQLPDYMIPVCVILLEQFPRTSSGKIDRKALPTPDIIYTRATYIPPCDRIEYILQAIWQDVLQFKNVSTHDNFFNIGGHSLLAVYLLARINKQFKRKYSLSWIFNLNTISKQAAAIRDSLIDEDLYIPIVNFNAQGNFPPLIFIHPGRGGSEAYLHLVTLLDPNIPFHVLESYNLYHQDHMVTSINALASYYITQIHDILKTQIFYLGGWSLGGLIAYEMAQQLNKKNTHPEIVFLIDSSTFIINSDDPMKDTPEHYLEYLNSLPDETKNRLLQVIDVEHQMLKNYQPLPYSGKVVLFQATQARNQCQRQWQPLVRDLTIHNVTADHYSIMGGEALDSLSSVMNQSILSGEAHE